jgi:hypothetical protein
LTRHGIKIIEDVDIPPGKTGTGYVFCVSWACKQCRKRNVLANSFIPEKLLGTRILRKYFSGMLPDDGLLREGLGGVDMLW